MTPEKAEAIKAHAEALATLLYEEADPEQLTTLAGIEKTVRDQVLEHITPHIGVFLSARRQEQSQGGRGISKASLETCPSVVGVSSMKLTFPATQWLKTLLCKSFANKNAVPH